MSAQAALQACEHLGRGLHTGEAQAVIDDLVQAIVHLQRTKHADGVYGPGSESQHQKRIN